MNGTDLLAEFRERRSENAFAELVRRYTNLVYSIAKRRIGNDLLAQEVTQIVFIRLAKAASKIRGDAELVGWLHRTTVHASIDLWRSENRRRAREEHAVAIMQTDLNQNVPWNALAPVLDDALNELNDTDRQAILLRFFDEKPMRDLGMAFGVSEDAAKMRVGRALDRLRNRLSSRGVTCSAVALAAILGERAVEAAPAQLVSALSALKFPVSAGVGVGIVSLLLHGSKAKLAAGLAATLFIGGAIIMFVQSHDARNQRTATSDPKTALAGDTASAENSQTTLSNIEDTNNLANANGEPDPLKLLQAVAAARQRITSGSVEYQVTGHHFESGRKQTNDVHVVGLFDGQKLRFEQTDREYSYTLPNSDGGEFAQRKVDELQLDKEGAVKAGLLKGFESHHVLAYDGSILLDYWENDGKPVGTSIRDGSDGTGRFILDPRALGLAVSVGHRATPEDYLGYRDAKSIKLLGKEPVEGAPAWHVQVRTKYDDSRDFWIDVTRPGRVLKYSYRQNFAISKYGDPASPIPTEVTTMHYRNGAPLFGHRFVQSNAQFGIPVDPASFTLAGLGMQIATEVNDHRNSRRIGYWTGKGLSERLPSKKESDDETAPTLAEMLAVLEADPASPRGFDAATWILLNTPDGPEVEKAADVILREHIQGTNLVSLATELERVRHRCSKPLLRAMLDNNANPDVQATACFMLAAMFKDE